MPAPQLSHQHPPREAYPQPPWPQPHTHHRAQRLPTSNRLCLLPRLLAPTPNLTLHRGAPGGGTAAPLKRGCIAEPVWRLVKGHASHLQKGGVWGGLGGDNNYALPGYSDQHIPRVDCISGDEAPLAPTPGVGVLVGRGCSCLGLLLRAARGVREAQFLYLVKLDTQALWPPLHRYAGGWAKFNGITPQGVRGGRGRGKGS